MQATRPATICHRRPAASCGHARFARRGPGGLREAAEAGCRARNRAGISSLLMLFGRSICNAHAVAGHRGAPRQHASVHLGAAFQGADHRERSLSRRLYLKRARRDRVTMIPARVPGVAPPAASRLLFDLDDTFLSHVHEPAPAQPASLTRALQRALGSHDAGLRRSRSPAARRWGRSRAQWPSDGP